MIQTKQKDSFIPLKKQTKKYEGFRAKPYEDTQGISTIGYGFNLEDPYTKSLIPEDVRKGERKLRREEANKIFRQRYIQAQKDAKRFLGEKDFQKQPPLVKKIIIDMSYNMGLSTLKQFKKFKKALQNQNYQKAAQEMKDSRWYKQTGRRGKELTTQMLNLAERKKRESLDKLKEDSFIPFKKAKTSLREEFLKFIKPSKRPEISPELRKRRKEEELRQKRARKERIFKRKPTVKGIKEQIKKSREKAPSLYAAGTPEEKMIYGKPIEIPISPEYEFYKKLERLEPEKTIIQKVQESLENLTWKGLGYGLDAIGWGFLRAEYGTATPIKGLQENIKKKRQQGKQVFKNYMTPFGEIGVPTKEFYSAIFETLPEIKTGVKSFIPFTHVDPKKVKTFADVGGEYYEQIVGIPAPQWYKNLFGMSFSFATTPFIVGKIAKGLGKGFNLIRKTQLAKRIPWFGKDYLKYKGLKQITRLRTKGRKYQAYKAVKSTIDKKELKLVAKDLTKRIKMNPMMKDVKITPRAIRLRLRQLEKGGISTQRSLRELVNPLIKEFEVLGKEARKLNLLPEQTYITKLSKKTIKNLRNKREVLKRKLTKLEEKVVSPKTGKPIQKRFVGKAKLVRKYKEQIKQINDRIQMSYKLGGTKYAPRMYQTIEEAKINRRFPFYSSRRIRRQYAKARKPIPYEVRQAMGEVKEPGFPEFKRLFQLSSDIENERLFRQIARKTKWVSNKYKIGFYKEPLPNTKAYGSLAGKYVKPFIYRDIKQLVGIKGEVGAMFDSLIGSWKLGKVVLNPATHFRNMFSNSVLLDLSGMDHFQQIKYLAKCVAHKNRNSSEYKFAIKYLGRSGMIKGEIMDDMLRQMKSSTGTPLRKVINGWNRGVKHLTKKPANIYGQEEFIAKFMKYLQMRDKGWSKMRALREANKWLFDYNDLTTWEKSFARRIMPFYTFPRKALPRIMESFATNPYAIAKYPFLAWAETKYALWKLKLTDEDYEQIKDSLPEYMQQGSYLLMPYRDDNGNLRFFDWTYMVPWGELMEAENRGILKSVITNPMYQIVSDFSHNKSSWTGQKIYNDAIPWDKMSPAYKKEQVARGLLYFWRQVAPNLAPRGIYWDKLYEAATGKHVGITRERKRLIPETIAHTLFGLRTQGIDIEEQRVYEGFETDEAFRSIEYELNKLTKDYNAGDISRKKYDKIRNKYINQIKKLVEEEKKKYREKLPKFRLKEDSFIPFRK